MLNQKQTLFVTKKKEFDQESVELLHTLRYQLGIESLVDLKIYNRYDFLGLSEEIFQEASKLILSEVQVDDVFYHIPVSSTDQCSFGVRYLPAQYDQRADSALSCIKLLMDNSQAMAVSSRVFLLSGSITKEEFEKIKNYVINPVDSCEIGLLDSPEFSVELPPATLPPILSGFCLETPEQIEQRRTSMGLAMTFEDLLFCQQYFHDTERREPTETEIRVIDTYWSDHCRHTTFSTVLDQVIIENGPLSEEIGAIWGEYLQAREEHYGVRQAEKPITLMDMAIIGAKMLKKYGYLNDLDESEEINACGIHVNVDVNGKEEPWLLLFKNETHNHPTEIEPFGGAATCIGGAIRDPLSGRGYVFGAMRVTGSGNPLESIKKTLQGKLPQQKITAGALRGFSSYGNQIGLATGKVKEFYHPGFKAKRMECGAVLGAVPMAQVRREEPKLGDVVVLLGGRTGKDGIGGATGSSKDHTVDSLTTSGSEVQKGNPVTERKIQRFMRNPEVAKRIKRCNDFGAGGVAVAIGELCDGLDIDLDRVPLKYQNLNPTEITLSESQERMAMVIEEKDLPVFIELAKQENLEATCVALVTNTKYLRIAFQNKLVVSLSRDFLDTNGAEQHISARITPTNGITYFDYLHQETNRSLVNTFDGAVATLNTAMNRGMVEQFDSSIGAGTVIAPLGGKYQRTENDALVMKIPLETGETDSAAYMSYGYHPYLMESSPFLGAQYAVLESLARIAACGGSWQKSRLSFQEYFEKLGKSPEKWGKPTEALLGSLRAQWMLKTASIGGKDSMSGSFEDLHVPPTLVSFAVSPGMASRAKSQDIQLANGKDLYLLPLKPEKNGMPNYPKALEILNLVEKNLESGDFQAAQTVGMGGAAKAIANMCYGNKVGVSLSEEIDKYDLENGTWILREEWIGSFVVQIANGASIENFPEAIHLGTITEEPVIQKGNESFKLDDLLQQEESVFSSIFPTDAEIPDTFAGEILEKPYQQGALKSHANFIEARPKALVLTFPGTNCEYDMARKFEEAGANPEIFIFKNTRPGDIEESIEEIAKKIKESQIVSLPGGFSLGDEPDGSAKFITAVFRNAKIAEATAEFLNEREGLMLGICNGFQALIKLGLLPFGEIVSPKEENPTLTYNTIGRHISRYVYTKVVSNQSPWLSKAKVNGVYAVPVSHGEGRLVISDTLYRELLEKGQIGTTYTDIDGKPSYDIEINPNGSSYAIEGISSPDGRIFGKMGHSERIGKNIGKNIVGEQDLHLFESGVAYFK